MMVLVIHGGSRHTKVLQIVQDVPDKKGQQPKTSKAATYHADIEKAMKIN